MKIFSKFVNSGVLQTDISLINRSRREDQNSFVTSCDILKSYRSIECLNDFPKIKDTPSQWERIKDLVPDTV